MVAFWQDIQKITSFFKEKTNIKYIDQKEYKNNSNFENVLAIFPAKNTAKILGNKEISATEIHWTKRIFESVDLNSFQNGFKIRNTPIPTSSAKIKTERKKNRGENFTSTSPFDFSISTLYLQVFSLPSSWIETKYFSFSANAK